MNAPTASVLLQIQFYEKLELKLQKKLKRVKISRKLNYSNDYGTHNVEERKKLIEKDVFYLEEEIKTKKVIWLDDIYVTGLH